MISIKEYGYLDIQNYTEIISFQIEIDTNCLIIISMPPRIGSIAKFCINRVSTDDKSGQIRFLTFNRKLYTFSFVFYLLWIK